MPHWNSDAASRENSSGAQIVVPRGNETLDSYSPAKAVPRENFCARMRILHVVENLDYGSVENWLVRMLRHARNRGVDVDWTFYCTLAQPGAKDAEARALGAQVIHSAVPIGEKWAFVRALRAELRRGKYDVLHCHHDLVSSVYLVAALGLPSRIFHVRRAALPS
jgi:hypothetical protein